ncbi:LytR C-terminal domain-containing protein [Lapillicoccus sp.]|uniref:LytR C-terminal domain-containing protein n=1 Tax=Lapillicoccus sp. TaxID=1909287 RepID=UPI0025FB383E|nr:LytR C-terminal domain-containing protein [Lapillicoccus sp.]
MSYVVESGSSRRARRRRRTAITLIIVVAGLAFAFKLAASHYFDGATPATASGCPTSKTTTAAKAAPGAKPVAPKAPAAPALAPSQVTVNVYNATSRAGLAAETAKLVKARGYVVGTIANDPLSKSVAGPAEIRFGPNGAAAGALVQTLVAGSVPVTDARADASVDLVLGKTFAALTPAPKTPVTTPSPSC